MADTPKPGETEAAPSNGQAAPVTPATPPDTSGGSEVDKIKAELSQQMRANQLAKEENRKLLEEKEARDKADADAKAKILEEQNQFKDLYEQEKAKREAIETDVTDKERKAELSKAKAEALKEFSDEVKAIAEETGMDLADTDEATITAFKEKLTNISKRTARGGVGPNNPNTPPESNEMTPDELKAALRDPNSFHDLVTKRFPGIKSMTKPS